MSEGYYKGFEILINHTPMPILVLIIIIILLFFILMFFRYFNKEVD